MITLENLPFSKIHEGFLLGFSGYSIPMTPSEAELQEMLQRRGWRPELSLALMEDGRIVAFVLNGAGTRDGLRAAYNSGTGVAPSNRRHGLARMLMERSRKILSEKGFKLWVLEVLDTNEGALAMYERCGFEESRRLQCWSLSSCVEGDSQLSIHAAVELDPAQAEAMWDVTPPWQNSHESIARSGAEHRLLVATLEGQTAGYAIHFVDRPELSQLAVHPRFRGRGVGRALLSQVSRSVPMKILNVDMSGDSLNRFLESAGAVRTVSQYEMFDRLS